MKLIAIVDYGMGNLRSVAQALRRVAPSERVEIVSQADTLRAADRMVLPGQGAMPDCMRTLTASGLLEAVMEHARNKPMLGVCLGEQMLCDRSEEGPTQGLGLISGCCVRFPSPATSGETQLRLKVPHMGWNRVRQKRHGDGKHPLWAGIPDDSWFYFVHSYYVEARDSVHEAGHTEYGSVFTSAIARDNIFATQFHPEKSAAAGLRLYTNFISWNP